MQIKTKRPGRRPGSLVVARRPGTGTATSCFCQPHCRRYYT